MKGTVMKALSELVSTRFGKEKWAEILVAAGLPERRLYLPVADIDDSEAMTVIQSTCDVLELTLEQAAGAFGDYWINVYTPRIYPRYYEDVDRARDFIEKVQTIHDEVTRSMRNARPPAFTYEWVDDNNLIMTYDSPRGLLVLAAGIMRAVGQRFNEELSVTTEGDTTMHIRFLS